MTTATYMEAFDPNRIQIKCCMPVLKEPSQRGRDKKLGTSCRAFAKVMIDGKGYCFTHAKVKALEILLKESK